MINKVNTMTPRQNDLVVKKGEEKSTFLYYRFSNQLWHNFDNVDKKVLYLQILTIVVKFTLSLLVFSIYSFYSTYK